MRQRNDPATDYGAMARQVLRSGYTTSRLAAELGVSQPAVSRLANGHQRTLGVDAALRLIRIAGGRVELPPLDAAEVRDAA